MPARWLRGSLTRNRDFMTLWAGESVSLLGTQITLLALPLTAALIGGLLAERIGLRAPLLTTARRPYQRQLVASAARSVAPAAKKPTI